MFKIVINSILLGIGLAMDAFSVSLADGLNEPDMKTERRCRIAGTFAGFQFAMPMVGWFCVTNLEKMFVRFSMWVPWIALILLLYIGGHMILDGLRKEEAESEELGKGTLLMQGIATSIDALSVGFTLASMDAFNACISSLIIGIVTFMICLVGIAIGKKAGSVLNRRATLLGGVILVCIGFEIFLTGI